MLTIDKEFKELIPPLTDDEYNGLEESLLNEGCRDALIVWDGILVDGHNRYEICQKHNIPYKTINKDFGTRDDVIVWIIKNQFSRRNLPAYERARLALRMKPVLAEKAKEHQGTRTDICQNSDKSFTPIDTKKEIATAAGVSHDTIAKVAKIEKCAPEEMKQQLRTEDMSINQAYKLINEASSQMKPHIVNNSGNNEWYTPENYITQAREVMGSIDVDPASNDVANKIVQATTYYTVESNGLQHEWHGNVWLNPPYASDLIGKFVDKLIAELPNIHNAIVLVNNATETKWFKTLISKASAICFPYGRVKFISPNGLEKSAPLQGQALLYYGSETQKFVDVFYANGWCACPAHKSLTRR